MIGFLLQVFLIILVVSVLEIAYNSLVFRQQEKRNKLIFLAITVVTIFIAELGVVGISKLGNVPILGGVINMINSIFKNFVEYIPLKPILLWFVIPALLAWAFFVLKSTGFVITKKLDFKKWKDTLKQKQREKEEKEQANQQAVEMEKAQEDAEEDSIHFLDMEMSRNIKYQNILGLQRAYELAKSKGLQIAETDEGYVAVYSDGKGFKELKRILSTNSIDVINLQGKPSLVFFDARKATSIQIQDQFLKLKEGA